MNVLATAKIVGRQAAVYYPTALVSVGVLYERSLDKETLSVHPILMALRTQDSDTYLTGVPRNPDCAKHDRSRRDLTLSHKRAFTIVKQQVRIIYRVVPLLFR